MMRFGDDVTGFGPVGTSGDNRPTGNLETLVCPLTGQRIVLFIHDAQLVSKIISHGAAHFWRRDPGLCQNLRNEEIALVVQSFTVFGLPSLQAVPSVTVGLLHVPVE